MAAGAMFAVAAGLEVAGKVLGGLSARSDARSQARLAKFNSLAALYEAEQIKGISKITRWRAHEGGRRSIAEMNVRMAASGGRIDAGTALLVAGEAARELELQDVLMAYETDIAIKRKRAESAIGRWQAQTNLSRGNMQMLGGFLGAAASGFSAYSTYKREYG